MKSERWTRLTEKTPCGICRLKYLDNDFWVKPVFEFWGDPTEGDPADDPYLKQAFETELRMFIEHYGHRHPVGTLIYRFPEPHLTEWMFA